MKTVVAFLGVVALTVGAEWNALKVTYGKNGKGYYDLPWSVEEATAQGKWLKIDEDKKLNVEVFSQPQDPRLMILFDKKGTVAGLRLAFLKNGIDKKAIDGGHTFDFDYDNNPMYEKGNYFGKELWYTTVLLAAPNTLVSGGRAKLNKNTDSVAENVYFRLQGKWMEVSRDECKPNAEFEEANCFAGMGKHYFKGHGVDCTRREPVWTLYDNGKLIGVGLAGFGSYVDNNLKTKTYYEQGSLPVQNILRSAPSCVEDYVNNYGLMSMHVFLTKDAAKITCPAEDWRLSHC
ncbi:uncharacterized protein LOC128996930 isoform X1 [Macrosteles quadrilineatus]|uniref:uncharacterized protein LOC128996930 isoform X1 n=1 Tax=Macrosteles quadrilineatus TaxID=74068 RepID=UPI0023E2F982|nr:uncharacterized protein LOC128996930 isoform X1 [Macrosteles quadrilineatus]